MRIAINNCYGGYGVSLEALLRLIERDAKCVHMAVEDESWRCRRWEPYRDGYESENFLNCLRKDGKIYFLDTYNRTDPDLLVVIDEMGEEANEQCAELKIIEIPDGIDYIIENYDGQEWIAEAHRTWG